ncbi:MAG: hypothetical protein ACR2QE_19250 [Acidimicrobiales bacterium]
MRRTTTTRRTISVTAALLVGALIAVACDYVYPPFLLRVDQPVVMTGADIPDAIGLDPDRATLWRYDNGWVQIPVQVDERHVIDFGSQPSNNNTAGVDGTVYGNGNSGVTALQYSDPDTFVGADPDSTFDADDEIAFMGRDAGAQAPGGLAKPPGTVGGSGREITLVDPDGGTPGYVYLWYGQVGADPSAGEDYVDYDFVLDSGDYKTTYKRADGPNAESSTVSTHAYDLGMIDRWKTTDLTPADGTGVDVLDGFKSRFSFFTCARSNHTFANAHGAFVANIDGPVRAIRAYVGANSGPLTQTTWYFYPEQIEQVIDLRVHAIPSVMSFIDFSSAATGMEYGNSAMGGATATIDGNPAGDNVPTSLATWEYASGPQGGITVVTDLSTNITLTQAREWVDDTTPPYTECWGDDGDYYGVNSSKITSSIPNTDPRSSPFDTLQARTIVGVWAPGVHLDDWTPAWASEAQQRLDVSVSSY